MSINDFLDTLHEDAKGDLETSVDIEVPSTFPTPSQLYLEVPTWMKIENVVVVATDLKGSTKISYSKQDRVGARVYQASTGNCARIFQEFDAQFVDIQGDGLFGIFHGDLAAERAIAAAYTLKSFSVSALTPLISELLSESLPDFETGLKIGIDAGTLLAKRLGVRGEHNEPVWAGKPVNYATKCAQEAEAHELIVTDRFFRLIEENEFAVFSCGCVGGLDESVPGPLWEEAEVPSLGGDAGCKLFASPSSWCDRHGEYFCSSIRAGHTLREDVEGLELSPLKMPAAVGGDV